MSPIESETLARLRAANAVTVDEDRGHTVIAQAALQRILDEPVALTDSSLDNRAARRRRRRSPRGLALVLAAVLVGGGAAFGATDPLGWWSTSRGEAKYGANPTAHVNTPAIQQISCRPGSLRELRCVASRFGQQYTRIDAIQPPGSLSRTELSAYMAKRVAAGKMSAAEAIRFRADLAAVPDSFFSKYQLASRFGTYSGGGDTGNGQTLVPPAGVPEFLACEDAGRALSCQDLNGDHSAPIGAAVYMARPTADWRPAPSSRPDFASPPGITFTAAERRLLIDMLKNATVGRSSSSGRRGSAQQPATTKPPSGP
jgi:hypothetical protein